MSFKIRSLFCFFIFSTIIVLPDAVAVDSDIDVKTYQDKYDAIRPQWEKARKDANGKKQLWNASENVLEQEEIKKANIESLLNVKKVAIDGLNSSNETLQTRSEANKSEIDKNTSTIADLRKDLGNWNAQLTELEEQLNFSKKRLTDAEKKYSSSKELVRQENENVNKFSSRLIQARKDLSTNQTKFQEATRVSIDLAAELRTLKAEKDEREDELDSIKDERETLFTRLKTARETETEAITAVGKVAGQVDSIQADIKRQVQTIKIQDDLIKELVGSLAKIDKKITDSNAAIIDIGKKVRANNRAIADLEDEKEEALDRKEIADSELLKLEAQKKAIVSEIADIQTKIKTAEGDAKITLQNRLRELKNSERAVKTSLVNNATTRRGIDERLAEIPKDIREHSANNEDLKDLKTVTERELTRAREKEVRLEDQKRLASAKKRELESKKSDLESDLTFKNVDLERENLALERVSKRVQTLVNRREFLSRRRTTVRNLISSYETSLSILNHEAIPDTDKDIRLAKIGKDQAQTDITKFEKAKRESETLVAQQGAVEKQAQVDVERERKRVSAQVVEQKTLDTHIASAKRRIPGLEAANRRLDSDRETWLNQIESQKRKIKTLVEERDTLNAQLAAAEKRVDEAARKAKGLKDIYDGQNALANKLDRETKTALANLTRVKANFASGLAAALAKSKKDGAEHGAKEGRERGGEAGKKLGADEGQSSGEEAGKNLGKQKVYQAAHKKAYDVSLKQTIDLKSEETETQKKQRLDSESLQQSYKIGLARGKQSGEKVGAGSGANEAKLKQGYEKGIEEGKKENYKNALITHKPMGEFAKEKEIFASEPSETKEVDAQKEASASLLQNFSQGLAAFGEAVLELLVSEARAEGSGGVIEKEAIPKSVPKYANPQKEFAHGDYKKTYLGQYYKSYEDSYKSIYQSTHLIEYGIAFRREEKEARIKAENASYPDSEKDGKIDGDSAGLFEGLGYNLGYKEAYDEAKGKGEKIAYNEGLKKGKQAALKDPKLTKEAQDLAFEEGQMAKEAYFRNNKVIVWEKESQKLNEEKKNGKFEIGEKISLSGNIRNFGGVRAESGEISLVAITKSGVKWNSSTIKLGELEAKTNYNYSNLLVGEVNGASVIDFYVRVMDGDRELDRFEIRQPIFAPFDISFRYFYTYSNTLKIMEAGTSSGHHNLIKVIPKSGKTDDCDSLKVRMTRKDNVLKPNSSTFGKWLSLKTTGLKKLKKEAPFCGIDFFIRGQKSGSNQQTKIQVELKNKDNETVLDKVITTKVTVKADR